MATAVHSPARLLAISMILVVLAGCVGPGPIPDGPGGGAIPNEESNLPDDLADEPSVRTPRTVEECLATRWLLNNETWRAMLQPLTNASGGNVESVTGELILDLRDDGSFVTTYAGWTVTTTQEGGAAVIERNGVDAGEWAISGFTVELSLTAPGSAVEGYVDTSSGRFELPSVGTDNSASLEMFEFECGPEDLLATIDMGTVFFTLAP